MAITGIDTIEGKQIIAAGAVSAKSAEMAYNDENGNPITGYQVAGNYYSASNPSGFITGVDLTPYQTTAGMTAYQPAGDYYSASNPSGFITGVDLEPYQLTADMTAYQPVGDYYSASNPSGFITGLPEEEEVEFEEIDLTDYQPISAMTAYQSAGDYYSASNPSGFISEVPAGTMNESAFSYDASDNITGYNGSAFAQGGGSAPAYGYTDNGLISAIDTSGLYASSGTASRLRRDGTMGENVVQSYNGNNFYYMPINSPWTTADVATGIFSPLQYATGACLAMDAGYFKAYFKGNEWYVSNTAIGQALRGEVHQSRGVHISGATTAGYGFNLGILSVSGVNSTGSWKYGYQEDAALRAVSSCDMHESAFEYDANDKISGYNGSAFAGDSEFPQSATEAIETVTANSADWNGTTETVYSNSGAWGGSALPISAGPGIKLEMVNNTLVASTDETVLWSGAAASEVTLSESIENFESIKLVHNTQVEEFWKPKAGDAVRYWHTYGTMAQGTYKMAMVHLSMEDATHIANVSAKSLNYSLTGTETAPISVTINDMYALNTIIEVIGINRIAGGN